MTKKAKSVNIHFNRKILNPITENQKQFVELINQNIITICNGPAGSGKTFLSVGVGANFLLANKVKKLVITRPVVEAGENIGFLPGNVEQKVAHFLAPLMEELRHFASDEEIDYWKNSSFPELEICPLAYMRGRNYHNSYIILDEAQNCSWQQLKMLITRIGNKSKLVIVGDSTQTDLRKHAQGAFLKLIDRLNGVDDVGIIHLTKADIVRSSIIQKIIDRLD